MRKHHPGGHFESCRAKGEGAPTCACTWSQLGATLLNPVLTPPVGRFQGLWQDHGGLFALKYGFRHPVAMQVPKQPDTEIFQFCLQGGGVGGAAHLHKLGLLCMTVTSKIIKQIRKCLKCSQRLEWLRHNPLFYLFIYLLFCYFSSQVKSIWLDYVT